MAQLDAAPVLSGTAVLVLEDDFLILSELESVLQDAGARVIGPFRRLKEALAVVEQGRCGAAVLDVHLGPESAGPVADALTRRGTPFLFYTGEQTAPIRAEWPDCRIIGKPAPPGAIVAALANLLGTSRPPD
jgi:DNA-binding response OmpR family regulator